MKNKLRDLRTARNMTQEDLAEIIEVSRQTINAIEKQKFVPSLPKAFKMAKFFELPIKQIFQFGT
jgi:putative transcriptional regulator